MLMPCNNDDGHAKDYLMEQGWFSTPRAPEELYDLQTDPQEQTNLASDPAHSATLNAMRQRVDDWMRATDDPLLAGPVQAPIGARVTIPTSLRASETFTVTEDSPIE